MNKLLNISLCFILTLNFSYSQSIKRNVISSYGNSSNAANSIVETTFGQPPNIGTVSDGNNYIRQGFQQPLYNFIFTPGCTDSLACNYDPAANTDDGSCLTDYGCTDPTATNYDANATCDDGICTYCINDTSYTNITACDSIVWNGNIYTQSGIYSHSEASSNNYSMSFSESECLNININPISSSYFSCNVWMRSDYQDNGYMIMHGDDGWLDDYGFAFQLNNGYIELNVNATNLGNSTTYVTDGAWHFISFTFNNGISKLYIDGNLEISDSSIISLDNSPWPLMIGSKTSSVCSSDDGSGSVFNGEVDDLHLWNIALSHQEIQQYMQCPPTGSELGLMGYWNFEEGSGNTVFDLSANSNNGTNNGATYDSNVPIQSCNLINLSGCDSVAVLELTINQADTSYTSVTVCDSLFWNGNTYTQSGTYYANGSSNNHYSMNFDGNDYIDVANYNEYNNLGDFSVMTHFKTNQFHESASLIINEDYPTTGGFWQLRLDSGYIDFYLYNNNAQPNNEVVYQNNLYNDNQWHQVVVNRYSIDGRVEIYIDGVLVKESYQGTGIFQNYNSIKMGYGVIPGREYIGLLDDFCYWNRVLSLQEIQQYMNCPPTGNESGLVGYWNFEEGSGNTVFDLSANSNNGINNGATYDNNVPFQSCNLINVSGCDSVAVLELTINQADTSYTNITACDSLVWNGVTYDSSGTYLSNSIPNNFSIELDNLDDFLESSNNNSINTLFSLTNAYTVSFWVYSDNYDNAQLFDKGYAYSNASSDASSMQIWSGGNGVLAFQMYDYPTGISIATDPNSIPLNQWNHIVCTYNGGTNFSDLSIYINGVEQITSDHIIYGGSFTGMNFNAEPIHLGSRVEASGSTFLGFSGHYDDVSVYNYSLSSQEVLDLYNCILPSSAPLLFSDFEEGQIINNTVFYSPGANGNPNISIYSSHVPFQSCNLINVSGCDSVAVLELTINQADTSYTNITACDSMVWNGITYDSSGTYITTTLSNNYSLDFGPDAFNGNPIPPHNHVEIVNNINPTQEITIMGWVKIDGFDINDQRTFVMKCDINDNKFWLLGAQWNKLGFYIHSDGTSYGDWDWSQTDLGVGWRHVAGTYDGSVMKIYIDGQLDPMQISVNGGITSSVASTYFGDPIGGGGGVGGHMDNFSIWDIALSQQEIQDYMNCSPQGNESGLISYWNMEDYVGNVISDLANNNNGNIFNNGIDADILFSSDLPIQGCVQQLTNINGCDSVAVLELTINQADTSYTSVTVCDSLVWNGTTYTQSGTYSYSGSTGINNYSMSFDGIDDYITVNNNLGSVSELSISIWANIQNTSIGPKDLIGNWNGGNSSFLLSYEGATQEMAFISLGTSVSFPLSNNDFNSWINISISYDGSIISIYKNGTLMNTSFANGLIPQGSPIITFGTEENLNYCQSHWNNCSFEGFLDEIQIWNIALTQQEIQEYMNCPPTGNETGLVGYWDFDEGSGNTAFDLTSNGNNGAITGAIYDGNVPSQSCNLINVNGCDSVAVLNLTINQPDTSYTNLSVCDSYDWDSITYVQSGTYTNTYVNASGCDSMHTLNLMINSDTSITYITTCDSIIWNDSTYTQSGVFYSNIVSQNNHSINFDGNNDYIDIQGVFNPVSFSISFWLNTSSLSSQVFRINFDGGKYFLLDIHNNGLFYTSFSGGSVTNNTTIGDDSWHYVAFTYENGVLMHYVDGVLTSNNNIGLWSTLANTPATISLGVGTNNYMQGAIDDFSLWNTVLLQQEIQQYMNCPPTGIELGLVGYWNFEEGPGSAVVLDQTNNGNDGVINGAVYDGEVPSQFCNLTNVNGCDSTAVLDLTIDLSGCTDSTAINYNPLAACDDSSCIAALLPCSDLFISEYVEGLGPNNALEIYNSTNNIINLSDYQLERYRNGDTNSLLGGVTQLTGSLMPGDVWVITNGDTVDVGYGSISPILYSLGDQAPPDGSYPTPLHMNGDDAIVLSKISTGEIIDVFGRIGEDPGLGWTADSTANFTDANGALVWSRNHTLIRKSGVLQADNYGENLFDPSLQWDLLSIDTWNNLGFHHCDCPIYGCLDSLSLNYNVNANIDDGSCIAVINGCTDSVAINYNIIANTDDGSCIYCINDTSYTTIISCDSLVWNGTTYTQSGIYYYDSLSPNNNFSLEFDMYDDYIEWNQDIIPSGNHPNEKTTTVMAWSYVPYQIPTGGQGGSPNNGGYGNGYRNIFSQGDASNAWFLGYEDDGQMRLSHQWYDIPVQYPFGEWVHFAVVCDQNNGYTKLYKNGVLAAQTSSTMMPSHNAVFRIGRQWSGNTHSHEDWFGMIDDVQVWRTIFTASDIQHYMNCPPVGDEIGLIGYWDFEAGSGYTAYDQTPNGNHGLIHAASYNLTIPLQSCGNLTNNNGCDSVAVLDLTINQADTSYTSVTACDNYGWNDSIYTQSGTYFYNGETNNYSMSFDGNNQYIDVQHNSILPFDTTDFSISFDIKASTQIGGPNNNEGGIINKYYLTDQRGFYIRIQGTELIYSFSDTPSNNWNGTDISSYLNNQWFNIAFTCVWGDVIKVYVDGSLVDSLSMTNVIFSIANSEPLGIGRGYNYGNYSNLNLDNIQIWSAELSQYDIQEYMNCPPTGSEAGLVGYWNFEEGSGNTVFDLTTNSNDGTNNGATYDSDVPLQSCNLTNINGCDSVAVLDLIINQADTSYTSVTACDSYNWNGVNYDSSGTYYSNVSSNNNYSMSFDGVDDYIEATNISLVDEVTWGCNINPSSFAFGPGNVNHILGKYNPAEREFVLELDYGEVKINVFDQNLSQWHTAGSGYSINLNEWVSIVAIYNKNSNPSLKLYLDGVLVGSDNSYQNSINITNQPISISGSFYPFDGMIDNVFIFDRALDVDEIQEYMNCPPTGSESGLVGYWNFEEGSGNTVFDLTTNSNDGTNNGATYDSNVPLQSCNLININGCDSVAVLDLTINQADTSYTSVSACDNYEWNDSIYTQSGTYFYNGSATIIAGYDYIGSFESSNFYLSQNFSSWSDANQQCNLHGGQLVTISSHLENQFIFNNIIFSGLMSSSEVWIGLFQDTISASYSEPSGGWGWISGDTFNYTNWFSSEPNNSPPGNENFASMKNNGEWTDQINNRYSGLRHVMEIPTQLSNVNGCDSTAVLNLTINQPDTSYISVTACDSLIWNDVSYDSSGTYYYDGEVNNYSMSFDGQDDYVDISASVTNDFTFITWIYHNQFQNGNNYILESPSGSTIRLSGYGCNATNNQTSQWVLGMNGQNTNHCGEMILNDQEWIHIAVTQQQDSLRFYINGQLDVVLYEPVANSRVFTNLGGIPLDNTWNGFMDNVSFWDIALSISDINNFMICPPVGFETGLVGCWNFEEGSGNIAFDLTSNGNDGTINGATYDSNVPLQSCNLTNINGCDSVAVLDLIIGMSGCMDDLYIEYDSLVICSDSNACINIIVEGCTDSLACNYDANANISDSSCIYIDNPVVDLTLGQWIMEDNFACDSVLDVVWYVNYSNDGTLIYDSDPTFSYPYSGIWSLCDSNYIDTDSSNSYWYAGLYENDMFNGVSANGCWIMYPDLGCTDPLAINYNEFITIDDGSCIAILNGCTDSTALNYNPNANIDDGSCTYCNNDTSYTTITACDSVFWNGNWYTNSGVYDTTFVIAPNNVNNLQSSGKEGNIWYFGQGAGLDFNSGVPVPLTDGQLYTLEGCASISDANGDILFYTDGSLVYNRNHTLMPNGTGLWGHESSSQSAIIVKKPESSSIYYIFTVDGLTGWNQGLNYSEVDMSLDGGLGDVTSNKNIPLIQYAGEKITVVSHANGTDFWIVARPDYSNTFQSFLLSANGVDNVPVISNALSFHGATSGHLRSSQDGSRIAICYAWFANEIELYDFDNQTGILSNPVTSQDMHRFYGIEFSPDGNLLYATTWHHYSAPAKVMQYDLSSNPLNALVLHSFGPSVDLGTVQLAPDNKIYVAEHSATDSIGVINNPNNLGLNCNYTPNSISLSGRTCHHGLPSFYNTIYIPSLSCDSTAILDLTIGLSGCTDPAACNYDVLATCDDGSCLTVYGCTDPTATNYDANATCDDGNCTYCVYGCTDPTACNYDALATCDDGSCLTTYGCTDITACNYDINATCDDGSCLTVYGCTDPTATNYDANATCDDGNCTYCIYGCTDSTACNYDALATCDDGSCLTVYGCTDLFALNYDVNANCDDGSCVYCVYGCMDITACNYDISATCDDGTCILPDGCTDPIASNYNPIALCDDGSCIACIYGCMDITQVNYDPFATCDDGSCIPYSFGCMDPAAINYNPMATASDGSCLYLGCTDSIACNYDINADLDDGSCNLPDGCTDSTAFNFDPSALCDDGSCIAVVYGCTDLSANNYDILANTDDGSCEYTGCTDPLADNYNPIATVDDGSCTYPVNCGAEVTGMFVSDIIDDRVVLNWDNMNTYDANGDQVCRIDKLRIKYRPLGTTTWLWAAMGDPSGYDVNGFCNSTQVTSKARYMLQMNTTYEWWMRAWYCSGEVSSWVEGPQFTTAPQCPVVGNLSVVPFTNPNNGISKATFSWDDSNGPYVFCRIKMRVDSISNPVAADWLNVGGGSVPYGTFTAIKYGLTPGESYRAQAKGHCDPTGHPAYNSLTWTPLIFWTQPSLRVDGTSAITNLDVYPNPSRDVFNISFTSESVQDLKIRVLNLVGEEVVIEKKQQFVGEYVKSINLNKKSKGIYFLEIETDGGIINKKLILQ